MSKNFAEIMENNFFQSSELPSSHLVVDAVRHPSLCDALFSSVEALEKGLTRSEFSRRYLHADRNYLSVCRNRQRGISARRLLLLCQSLRQRSSLWRSIASSDHRVQQHCQARAAAYADLAADVLSLLTHISHRKR
jgi:hypothetical protein